MGMLYQRGDVWWVKYYRNGKSFRESTKTTKKMVAEKILKRREGEIAQGKNPSIEFEKVTFDQLAKGFIQDYKINQKKSLERAEISLKHLSVYFGGWKVPQITTWHIKEYTLHRHEAGAANATINRELAALKRMLNLGDQQTPPLVDRVPHIPMLKEKNVRRGFFEHEEFLSLRDALPDPLKGLVTFAYKTGWRVGEITNLTWDKVNLKQGVVKLHAEETKNGEGRTVCLDGELMGVMGKQRDNMIPGCPYVFHRLGRKISDFRTSWAKACTTANLQGKLFHDFRRTAVRNIVRSGVTENVVMRISGHKTRSVFDRYDIVSLQDLKLAAAKQEAYLNDQVTGTIWAQSDQKAKKKVKLKSLTT
ncbi:MAG: site-specific integrase [Desulfobulbaceae bacterium]|nr:site-specific integrase [Desulfobulbaceae bacterium]